jgi:hypothetical protein
MEVALCRYLPAKTTTGTCIRSCHSVYGLSSVNPDFKGVVEDEYGMIRV